MVQNYCDYPDDIQVNFCPQPQVPIIQSRPQPSGGSTRITHTTYDGEAQ
jgi:hypothetical protein